MWQVTSRLGNLRTLLLSLLTLAVLGSVALLCLGLAWRSWAAHRLAVRGIEPPVGGTHAPALGVNVSLLDGVPRADATRQFDLVRDLGLTWVRQPVTWAAVEPHPGDFDWNDTDALVAAAQDRDLQLVVPLVDAPTWSRAVGTAPGAPPRDPADFGRFVAAFVSRYRGQVAAIQVWDNPNLAVGPDSEFIPARQYTELLRAGFTAAKQAAPDMVVLAGGLAPTTENSSRNQDEVQYLETLYRAGAAPLFDALAIKPYGFWSGPDDRRANPDVLNFSRAVLLREIMRRYGDANKSVWAVEWGWNALPPDWGGRPSPWGSDSAERQAERTAAAIHRAQSEWPWLSHMILMHLAPSAPADDPVRGFTLLDSGGRPRPPLHSVAAAARASAPQPVAVTPTWTALTAPAGLVAVGLAAAIGALLAATRLPWRPAWRALDARLALLGEPGALLLPAACLALLLAAPSLARPPLLLLLALLLARRLDIALAAIVLTAPFFLQPVALGGPRLPLVEVLTLLTFVAWAVRQLAGAWDNTASNLSLVRRAQVTLGSTLRAQLPLSLLDWSVLLLLVLGTVSPLVALRPGVANRELRVVILEPILFYIVLRGTPLDRRALLRLADALVLAGVTLAVHAFATYGGEGGIAAEGVRRLRGIYGSPNNLALTLGRVIPVSLTLALWGSSRSRRLAYAVASLPILIALFLTFSSGAWLLGVPAALIFLGLIQGRRALLGVLAGLGLAVAALLPFASSERVARLVNLAHAETWERRRLVWQAGLNMIRDHPWLGVGLDNFLYEYHDWYVLPGAEVEPNLSHPHNLVLDFWTRLGILGVVVLIAGQVAFFSRATRLLHRLQGSLRLLVLGLMASMVDFLAHGLIDNTLFLVDLAFIYMLTIGVVRNIERQP